MKSVKNLFFILVAVAAFFAVKPQTNANAAATGNKIADVSQYQGNINWAKASTDLRYVIIRVQHGTQYLDSKQAYNSRQAVRYGVPFGVYAFSNFNSKADAIREAKAFYQRSNKKTNFYVLDDEIHRKDAFSSEKTYINAWISTMKSLTNKPLILYSGENFAKTHGINAISFDGYWIANYSHKPAIKTDLWQYTSKGTVSGIKGRVDLSKITNPSKVADWFTHSNDDNITE